jgi:ABC-type transport system involved in multi-copper enzyme maturation permease subunit
MSAARDALALARADLLKLRRRRALMALSLLLSAGGIVAMFGLLAIRHASEPGSTGPAGGVDNFRNAVDFLGLLAVVVGAMLGATAGAADAEAGTLGDLLATGRSRRALYISRLPAALGVTALVTLLALAIAAAASILLAGDRPTPGVSTIAAGSGATLALALSSAAVAVGLATLVGSRGPVIGVVAVGQLVVSQVLVQVGFLGPLRDLIPLAAFGQLAAPNAR